MSVVQIHGERTAQAQSDAEDLFMALPPDGRWISNPKAYTKLGWNRDRYFAARAVLAEAGRVLTGPGRGGTVRRTKPAVWTYVPVDQLTTTRGREVAVEQPARVPKPPAPARKGRASAQLRELATEVALLERRERLAPRAARKAPGADVADIVTQARAVGLSNAYADLRRLARAMDAITRDGASKDIRVGMASALVDLYRVEDQLTAIIQDARGTRNGKGR